MAFNLGTLGFMAPFHVEKYKDSLNKTLKGAIPCILRNRLCFSIGNMEDSGSVSNGRADICDNIVREREVFVVLSLSLIRVCVCLFACLCVCLRSGAQ